MKKANNNKVAIVKYIKKDYEPSVERVMDFFGNPEIAARKHLNELE